VSAGGCAQGPSPAGSPAPVAVVAASSAEYEATIHRSPYGVAHIEAADVGGLGFGEGYAQAEDHLCSIADQVVRVRGERAKYFGRGPGGAHLANDLAVRALRVPERAAALLATHPAEVVAWLEGFAAGYNLYLGETGRDAVPGWCRGAEWVAPITAADLVAYQYHLALFTTNFAGAIAAAEPPAATHGRAGPAGGPTGGPAAATGDALQAGFLAIAGFPGPRYTASNGWALGRDLSAHGTAMLVANPHYPWTGSNRFWEKHLRIPGEVDVYGVNLVGVPGVLIGFTRGVAWTHTVSAGTPFTLYAVDLVPGHPTRYRHGDE
jgi:acyl-homoserine-lactone acylase